MKRILAILLLALALAGCAQAEMYPPTESFGPLLDAHYDYAAMRDFTHRYESHVDSYGRFFFTWPHEARAEMSALLTEVGSLPGVIVHGVPDDTDLPEADILAAVRESLAMIYDFSEETLDGLASRIAYDATNPRAPVWIVDIFPSTVKAGDDPIGYIALVDRQGQVFNVEEHRLFAESTYVQSPYEALARAIWKQLDRHRPFSGWSTEQKLALNALSMLRLMGNGYRYGLPQDGMLTDAQALDAAEALLALHADIPAADVDALWPDAEFITGDTTDGAGSLAALPYPYWRITFRGPPEKDAEAEAAGETFMPLLVKDGPIRYQTVIHPTSGALMQYTAY